MSEKFKLLPAKFDQQRLTKFVNYLTAKRFPTNIKSAYFLTRTAVKLTDNEFAVPVVLNRQSPVSVSASEPNVLISVTNLLGGSIEQAQFDVEAESAKGQKAKGQGLFAAKKKFTPKSSDGASFDLRLVEPNQKVVTDFYLVTVTIQSKPASKKYFLVQNKFEVKLTTQITVADVQVGVADRDHSAPKLVKVEENTKLKEKLDADQMSKLYLKFSVKEKSTNTQMEVHQAFVRFSEASSGREIIFLAQPGVNSVYGAEIDFSANAKNFRRLSGLYSIDLIISDSLAENAISWQLADIKLQFSEDQTAAASASQDKAKLYAKKPEITHLFRESEKTPPVFLSTLFAALCLAPLGLLVILWLSVGVNFSKFTLSPSAIVFHLSLAAIFGLFYCYWTRLNMFQTLRYLAILSVVAFLSGNKLLKNLVAQKEKKN